MKAKRPKTASRASKQRFWRCHSCKKRFKNPQAVRGHQLHCQVRRLKTQAEAQPASAGKSESREHHRPGPDSQDNKLLLLETYEAIKDLIEVLELIVVSAQFFFQAASSHVKDNIPPEEWAQLYADLCSVERDFEQMIGLLRLDQRVLFQIYHRLGVTRETWLYYREHDRIQSVMRRQLLTVIPLGDNDAVTLESQKMIAEDKARLDDVVNKVKRLLVAAR